MIGVRDRQRRDGGPAVGGRVIDLRLDGRADGAGRARVAPRRRRGDTARTSTVPLGSRVAVCPLRRSRRGGAVAVQRSTSGS